MPNMSQPKLMKMTKENLPIKLKNSLIIHKEVLNENLQKQNDKDDDVQTSAY